MLDIVFGQHCLATACWYQLVLPTWYAHWGSVKLLALAHFSAFSPKLNDPNEQHPNVHLECYPGWVRGGRTKADLFRALNETDEQPELYWPDFAITFVRRECLWNCVDFLRSPWSPWSSFLEPLWNPSSVVRMAFTAVRTFDDYQLKTLDEDCQQKSTLMGEVKLFQRTVWSSISNGCVPSRMAVNEFR